MATSTNYGKRLIPQIMDSLASTEPDRIIYSIATSSDISRGLRHVSAATFAKAVDKTAWLLHNQIGQSPVIQSVGYIGPRKMKTKQDPRALHVLFVYLIDSIQMIFDTFC